MASEAALSIDLKAEQAAFGRLARVAQSLFGAVFADVVLLHEDFVWRNHLGENRTDDPAPLVLWAMRSKEVIWIDDARKYPAMAEHPLVSAEGGLRFYAGAPICTADGAAIGALTLVDVKCRDFDQVLADRLMDLAMVVGAACDQARERDLLAKAERRLSVALQIADVHVWEADYRRGVLEKAGAEDTFFERPITFQDIESNLYGLVHPADREALEARAQRLLAGGAPEVAEYRINREDGKEVWASSVVQVETNAEGKPTRLIGAMQNVTRRKQAEALTVQARDLAEAANRAKSEFLANMSHELRTPLNGVLGIASVLAATKLNASQREMVRLVENSAQSLEALLADILDLARLEAGRLAIRPEPFDLGDAIRVCADLFEPSAQAKGLTLSTQVSPAVQGQFVGDAMRIRQIVCNLTSNAVKFTSAGSVTIAVDAAVRGGDADLTFTVSDTGIGFSEDQKAHLFERFEQADGSITRRFGGMGMGLSICRALVEAMGGELSATSAPGQGSAFTITLRLPRVAAAAPSEEPADDDEATADGISILYAEDNPTNQRVVELIMQAAGVDLDCVENGALCVEAWALGRYDMVLMDMQMPVMDGLTAIRAIRQREAAERRPRIPIYTLTANALPEHARSAIAAGADGHLTKPITAAVLLTAVSEALEGAEAAGAAAAS